MADSVLTRLLRPIPTPEGWREKLGLDQAGLISLIGSASTTAQGVVELATDAEANAASDTGRALTPSNLAALTGANLAALGSSTTAKGIVELATSAETITGTDTTRAVTPAGGAAAYQGLKTLLTNIGNLSMVADRYIYGTGTGTVALGTITSFARTMLANTTKAEFLADLSIVVSGDVSIADDQVGALLTVTDNTTGILFTGANASGDVSIFGIDTTGTNGITTMVLGGSAENGGLGTPSAAAGTDTKYGVYIGTDDIIRVSNRRGATLSFGAIYIGIRGV